MCCDKKLNHNYNSNIDKSKNEKTKNCDSCTLNLPSINFILCSHEFCSNCIIEMVYNELKLKRKNNYNKDLYKNIKDIKKDIKDIKCPICKKIDVIFIIDELENIINDHFNVDPIKFESQKQKDFIKENAINCEKCKKSFSFGNLEIMQFSCAHIYCEVCFAEILQNLINYKSLNKNKKKATIIPIDIKNNYNPTIFRQIIDEKYLKQIHCPDCTSTGTYSIDEAINFMNKAKGVKECKDCSSTKFVQLLHNCEVCEECQKQLIYKENGDSSSKALFKIKDLLNLEFFENKCINCSKYIIDYKEKTNLFTTDKVENEMEKIIKKFN